MNSFLKTCITNLALLAALAAPVVIVGCDHPSDPPVDPRAAAGAGGPGSERAAGGADREPSQAVDATITMRVKTALMADEAVKGLDIDVDTRDAEVTLSGALEHQSQVIRAVDVANRVEGVRKVVNRLSVKGEDKAAESTKG